ncbi:MAG: protein-export chaperone SecB [Pseudomonadota bacterium]
MSEPKFTIFRQYVKDISFESILGHEMFTTQWQPEIHVDIGVHHTHVEGDRFEVDLVVTVNLSMADKPAYLLEVNQAGLFDLAGIDGEELDRTLGILCPTMLYPYAREAIDNIAVRAGSMPIGLQPINFEELYTGSLAKTA